MLSFLDLAAQKIFENHNIEELQNLQIILPGRRAAQHLKIKLSESSPRPFFGPKIDSIDDFIIRESEMTLIDPIRLYFEIFEIWSLMDQEQQFDQFLTWVPTIIKDFNLLDTSLISKPESVFNYMSEAEAIKRWGMEETLSEHSIQYFSFFDKMGAVYFKLRQILEDKKLAYNGMAYRLLAENTEKLISKNTAHYYFLGLNALSKAEEKIIQTLIKAKKATCIWDSDEFYMESENKAGRKLRMYRKNPKMGSGEWYFMGNNLLGSKKEINVYETGSNVMQSKVGVSLALQSNNHALIVLNEKDFLPLLTQLSGFSGNFNLSAGISFKTTSLSAFLEIILNFPDYGKDSIETDSIKTLSENLTFQYLSGREREENDSWKEYLESVNSLYISKEYLLFNSKTPRILKDILKIKDTGSIIDMLWKILNRLTTSDFPETQFAHLLINEIKDLIVLLKSKTFITKEALKLLIKEISGRLKVPFEKEVEGALQVMSLLETRCLDFEEVTFISFKEGNLPSGKKLDSFFAYDAAVLSGLPIYSDQDAIMAYHFFRLLQRAKKINLIYSDSDTLEKTEPSRFLFQIEQELVPQNPYIKLSKTKVKLKDRPEKGSGNPLEVQKTPDILNKIKLFLTEKGLSATAINAYYENPLGFYWKYIEKTGSKKNESAAIGHDTFGIIIHYALEQADAPFRESKKLITQEILENQRIQIIKNFDDIVAKSASQFDFNYGINKVLNEIAKNLIDNYYQKRIKNFEKPYQILVLEEEFEKYIEANGVQVKIRGFVDKIERHAETIQIVDYKTGKVEQKEINFIEEDLSSILKDGKKGKLRQLLLYNFLVAEEFSNISDYTELKFYSFRNLDADLKISCSKSDTERLNIRIKDFLTEMIEELLDPEIPFALKDLLPSYSDYKEILGNKNISESYF